jgi:hypothetical protein
VQKAHPPITIPRPLSTMNTPTSDKTVMRRAAP